LLQGTHLSSDFVQATIASAQPVETVEDVERVDVLVAGGSEVKYTMWDPRVRQNACTCETATQGNICAHQVAWLLTEYPHGAKAEKLMANMLGTRFGYSGGCSLLDITGLIDALNELEIAEADGRNHLSAPSKVAALSEYPAADPAPPTPRANQPSVPGSRAVNNHKEELLRMFQSMCSLLDTTPAENLASIMQTQVEQMSVLVSLSEQAASAGPLASAVQFQKKGDNNMRRHKSFLERTSVPRKKTTASIAAGSAMVQELAGSPSATPLPCTEYPLQPSTSIKAPAQEEFRMEAKKNDKEETVKHARKQGMKKAADVIQQHLQQSVPKRTMKDAVSANPSPVKQGGKILRQGSTPEKTRHPAHELSTMSVLRRCDVPGYGAQENQSPATCMHGLTPWDLNALARITPPVVFPGHFSAGATTSVHMPQQSVQVIGQQLYPQHSGLLGVAHQAVPADTYSFHPTLGCSPQQLPQNPVGQHDLLQYFTQTSNQMSNHHLNNHSQF
jgi:hypothetical protein